MATGLCQCWCSLPLSFFFPRYILSSETAARGRHCSRRIMVKLYLSHTKVVDMWESSDHLDEHSAEGGTSAAISLVLWAIVIALRAAPWMSVRRGLLWA